MIDFILTGLSFVLVGLQLRSSAAALLNRPTQVMVTTIAVCLTVIVIRPIWVFATVLVSRSLAAFLGETVPASTPPTAVLVVISWAGMRAVISLAVALSLPLATNAGQPFPGRDLIVFVAFAVILVTLIGQGLTLPALVRRMGVGGRIGKLEDDEIAIRLRLARVALQAIDGAAENTGASPDVVERVRGRYADRIERLERRHAVLVSSTEATARAGHVHDATMRLLEELTEIERGELHVCKTRRRSTSVSRADCSRALISSHSFAERLGPAERRPTSSSVRIVRTPRARSPDLIDHSDEVDACLLSNWSTRSSPRCGRLTAGHDIPFWTSHATVDKIRLRRAPRHARRRRCSASTGMRWARRHQAFGTRRAPHPTIALLDVPSADWRVVVLWAPDIAVERLASDIRSGRFRQDGLRARARDLRAHLSAEIRERARTELLPALEMGDDGLGPGDRFD
jgi:hypothetical protein